MTIKKSPAGTQKRFVPGCCFVVPKDQKESSWRDSDSMPLSANILRRSPRSNRFEEGLFRRDDVAQDKIQQRSVQAAHAELVAGLNDGFNHVDLVFTDQVADRVCYKQDFQCGDSSASFSFAEGLCDNSLEGAREHRADLFLTVRRELLNDTVRGTGGGGRMQRSEHKVTGSAVSSAISTVSRSRISPTSTISGSSRSAARSAEEKLLVWRPTSR